MSPSPESVTYWMHNGQLMRMSCLTDNSKSYSVIWRIAKQNILNNISSGLVIFSFPNIKLEQNHYCIASSLNLLFVFICLNRGLENEEFLSTLLKSGIVGLGKKFKAEIKSDSMFGPQRLNQIRRCIWICFPRLNSFCSEFTHIWFAPEEGFTKKVSFTPYDIWKIVLCWNSAKGSI